MKDKFYCKVVNYKKAFDPVTATPVLNSFENSGYQHPL